MPGESLQRDLAEVLEFYAEDARRHMPAPVLAVYLMQCLDAPTKVGDYRGFGIYHEADGWWAENDGGSCFGPFDERIEAEWAIDASPYADPQLDDDDAGRDAPPR